MPTKGTERDGMSAAASECEVDADNNDDDVGLLGFKRVPKKIRAYGTLRTLVSLLGLGPLQICTIFTHPMPSGPGSSRLSLGDRRNSSDISV